MLTEASIIYKHQKGVFMNPFHKFANILFAFLFTVLLLLGISNFASSEEIYKFERMWPVMQQPWYFNVLPDIAIDKKGYLYISEKHGY